MKRTMLAVTAMAVVMIGVGGPAAASEERWRLRLGSVAAQTTVAGDEDTAYGLGLGLEYRLSPRLGLELGALTAEPRGEARIEIFDDVAINLQSSFRMTPVMAKLALHLTPGRRADLYVAPTAAYVRMSDVTLRVSAESKAEVVLAEVRIATADELAWGLALGVDVPLGRGGRGRSLLTLGATYLRLPLTVRDGDGFTTGGDIDPLLVQLGYGVRF